MTHFRSIFSYARIQLDLDYTRSLSDIDLRHRADIAQSNYNSVIWTLGIRFHQT